MLVIQHVIPTSPRHMQQVRRSTDACVSTWEILVGNAGTLTALWCETHPGSLCHLLPQIICCLISCCLLYLPMTANFGISRAQLEEATKRENPGVLGHYQHGVCMARVITQKDNRAARLPQSFNNVQS